jgi:preprotein translocase subunit YajC
LVAPLAWLVLMGGVFYVLIWRPQQRRVASMRALQGSLELGDEIITTAGIYGTITALRDDYIEVQIAPNTNIRVARGAIGQRMTNNESADHEHPHDGPDGLEETG